MQATKPAKQPPTEPNWAEPKQSKRIHVNYIKAVPQTAYDHYYLPFKKKTHERMQHH